MVKVKFNYKYAKDYNTILPTDARGSINPRGRLVMDLFTDINASPEFMIAEIDSEGKAQLSTNLDIYSDSKKNEKTLIRMDRIIFSKVILAPDDAISIGLWMLKTVINDKRINLDKNKLKLEFEKLLSNKVEKDGSNISNRKRKK